MDLTSVNPFVLLGAGGVGSTALYWALGKFSFLNSFIRDRLTCGLHVLDKEAMILADAILKESKYPGWEQWVPQSSLSNLRTTWIGEDTGVVKGEDLYTLPSGYIPIKFRGKRLLVSVVLERDEHGKVTVSMHLSTYRWNRQWLLSTMKELIRAADKPPEGMLVCQPVEFYGLAQSFVRPARSISTIVHKGGAPERILEHIRKWESARERYIERGVNHQLGILLHGPPGTGKTSCAIAIASELGKVLVVVPPGLTPERIRDVFLQILSSGRSREVVVLMEEVDSYFPKRHTKGEKEKETTKQTANLLSLMDGPLSLDGTVKIYTTNHFDKLDPSFVRPGRCDVVEEFTDKLTPEDLLPEHSQYSYKSTLGRDGVEDHTEEEDSPDFGKNSKPKITPEGQSVHGASH